MSMHRCSAGRLHVLFVLLVLVGLLVPIPAAASESASEPPTPAATCPKPVLITPGDGDSVTCPVKFTWSSINVTGEYYDVTVLDNRGALVFTQRLTSTSLTKVLPPGDYQWGVQAGSPSCTPTTVGPSSFHVTACCPTAGTSLLSPDDRSEIESPVSFSWNSVSGASSYTFYLLQESVLVYKRDQSGTTQNLSLDPGTYEWFVRVNYGSSCPYVESTHRLFKVAAPPPVCPTSGPALVSPSDGMTTTSPVRFEWNKVTNATGYRFVLTRDSTTVLSQTQSGTRIDLNLDDGTYTWWVEALAANCPPQSSARYALKISSPTTSCPAEAPKLQSPGADATVNVSSVSFSWSSVANATAYVLRIFDSSGLVAEKKLSTTSATVSLPDGKFGWYVAAAATDCEPISSPLRYVIVDTRSTSCPGFGPALTSPTLGAKVSSPLTFVWSPVPGATEYRFVVATSDRIVEDSTQIVTSLRRDLPAGNYVWWVEARGSGCDPQPSDKWFFAVASTGTDCPTAGPALISPAKDTEVGAAVHFSWSTVPGATSYDLVVFDGDTVVFEQEGSATELDTNLDPGIYSWVVEARKSGCAPVLSSRFFFAVTCGKGAPTLVAPVDGATVSTKVTFSWSAVEGAAGYRIQVFFAGGVYVETTTTSLTASFELRPGVYQWVVLSLFDSCPPEGSAPAEFKVEGAVGCPTAGPVLVSPAADASVTSLPISFQWQAVVGADRYWVLLSTGNDEFRIVADTDTTSAVVGLPPGTYRWLVVALVRDCDSVKSEVRRFTIPQAGSCDHGKPTVLQPADGSSVMPPVTFAWTPVADALGYTVFLRPETGTPTPVLHTSATSGTLDRLPPGPYEWFVAAEFDRCPPTASDPWKFEVPTQEGCDRRSPFLLSPGNGAEEVPNPVFFSWTPVPDATLYRLWVAVGNGAFSNAGETTETKLSVSVTPGPIRWYVEAELTSCPSVTSEPSRFQASDSGAPCGVTAAPMISVPGSTSSGKSYVVRWSAVANADSYELDEAMTPEFREPTTVTTSDLSEIESHDVVEVTAFFYRVRGIDKCTQEPGPYSRPIRIVIRPPIAVEADAFDLVKELGDLDPLFQVLRSLLSSSGEDTSKMAVPAASLSRGRGVKRPEVGFTASSSVPWLTISPSSGTLSGGYAEITASADPADLPPGTSTAIVTISASASASDTTSSSTTTVPVSVTLVTPVVPAGSTTPPPDALIVPYAAHSVSGETINGYSDVSLSNTSASTKKYQVSFRSLDDDGRVSTLKTEVQLAPGQTSSLEDVLANWFGASTSISGSLEIHSLDEPSGTLSTGNGLVAAAVHFSSAGSGGTLAQAVPIIPFSSFTSKESTKTLVVPEIESSATQSSRIGIVEGSGEDATVTVSVFDGENQKIAEESVDLQGGETVSLDDLLGEVTVSAGRAEIAVTSDTGQIIAFNRLSNLLSGDSRLIPATSVSDSAETQVVAGASDVTEGSATRTTDLWLYNPESSEQTVTLTFYPESDPGSAQSKQLTLSAGESRVVSSVVGTLFSQFGTRGVIHVDSTNPVIVSADDQVDASGVTTGSVLPVVAASKAIGVGDSPQQLLHVTESPTMTSSVGVAEVTGNAATVEVTATVPGSLSAPTVSVDLEGYEFREIGSILTQMGFGETHNARVSVSVVSGSGKVTSYAALTDRETSDVTVVPAGR